MIKGIGADIVDIRRIEALLSRFGGRFERKCFTDAEIKAANKLPSPKRPAFLAKRFAAKEALSKALGTGIGKDFSFKDAEFLPVEGKGAEVSLSPLLAGKLGEVRIHVSLSDEPPYAQAFVVVEFRKTLRRRFLFLRRV